MDITVTMTEPEILAAIKDFLFKHDVVSPTKEIEITLVAGRGANGHSAVIAVKNAVTAGIIPEQVPSALNQEHQAIQKAQNPVQEIPVAKGVPMPSAPKDLVPEANPGPVEVTAQTTENLNELFGSDSQAEPESPVVNPEAAQLFDENAVSDQPVDKLFE